MSLANIWNFFMPVSMAVSPDCDFYQEMAMGQQYYIYNPQYPQNYSGAIGCRWTAHSTQNTRIVLSCEELLIPAEANCKGDRLAVSLKGDRTFTESQNYCGNGTFSLVSTANTLTIGLFSRVNSIGGRFICSIVAIKDHTSETKPQQNIACDCGWKEGDLKDLPTDDTKGLFITYSTSEADNDMQTRIVGGHETGINEFPSMAGLVLRNNNDLYCGAAVISNRYALTAGHCIYQRDANSIALLVGDHNISTGFDTPYSALYFITAYEIHPDFDYSKLINDIGIIKTSQDIVYSMYVGPVCLPFRFSANDFYGQTTTILGWGLLEFSGMKSDTLQEVDVTVISNAECSALNSNLLDSQMCTYYPDRDACQSDSGGPLLWMDTSSRRLQLIGLVSYGLGCGSTRPSVNTRVTSFLTWIVSRTSDAGYCIK